MHPDADAEAVSEGRTLASSTGLCRRDYQLAGCNLHKLLCWPSAKTAKLSIAVLPATQALLVTLTCVVMLMGRLIV